MSTNTTLYELSLNKMNFKKQKPSLINGHNIWIPTVVVAHRLQNFSKNELNYIY